MCIYCICLHKSEYNTLWYPYKWHGRDSSKPFSYVYNELKENLSKAKQKNWAKNEQSVKKKEEGSIFNKNISN